MAEKIKVMQVLSPLTIAGAERVVLMLERYLDKEQFELSLCLFLYAKNPENPFVSEARKSDINIRKIFLSKIFEWRQVKELADIIQRDRIDILHTHSHRADIIGYIANKFWNARMVSTLHGWTPVNLKVKLYESLETFFLRRFDCVIAVSQDIRERLVLNKVDPCKINIVPNALNFSSCSGAADGIDFRSELGLNAEVKLIGTVARLSKEKGIKHLLYAAKAILKQKKNVKFVIVGDGPEKDKLLKIRNELALNKYVIFTGYRSDVSRIYQALDMFVLPSLSEGLPISLLEAAYFKKPIIATRVGGIPELFENHIILVNPANATELAERVLYLLNNIGDSREYGSKVSEIVLAKCDPVKWAIAMQSIYIKLMRNKSNK